MSLFVVFFLTAFVAAISAMIRIQQTVEKLHLPWAAASNRSSALLVGAEFSRHRFWIGVGFLGAFSTMAAMIIMFAIFGTPDLPNSGLMQDQAPLQ